MRRPQASAAAMAKWGWVRLDGRPWTKCAARWVHSAGWTLEHCGHPTALTPWMLKSPSGQMICTGAATAPDYNPAFGTCWPTLLDAAAFVASARSRRVA